ASDSQNFPAATREVAISQAAVEEPEPPSPGKPLEPRERYSLRKNRRSCHIPLPSSLSGSVATRHRAARFLDSTSKVRPSVSPDATSVKKNKKSDSHYRNRKPLSPLLLVLEV